MPSRSPPERRPRRILILEPDAEGHSLEWLQHLVAFTTADKSAASLCIAAPAELCDTLARSTPPQLDHRIGLLRLLPREQERCTQRSLVVASFARWSVMRRYLRLSGADAGFFLSIDLLSLPLALGLGLDGRPVSGILFRPSIHYRTLGNYRPSLKEKLRDLRKDLLYRLMLRNRHVRTVLSLDPFFPRHAASHYAGGGKVLALPDPAFPLAASPCKGAGIADFPPAGRTGMLLFGYLTERKGPLVVLDALRLLPSKVAERVAVLFAGRTDPEIRAALEARRSSLQREQPQLWFQIEDRRLERDELEALVAQSDVVLAPYQRFVGSSGVLLWAARAGRPVLAQDFGLVGRLIRDHRLGAVADASDPAALAHAIERMVVEGPQSFIDTSSAKRFAAARTPDHFAAAVLSSLSSAMAS
ncbi:MAG: glycosyltransferase [Alphaproteobacteria bacterium]|nr:glycosyltransferase [Alphaproteobacteria bacterium]MBV8406049.1 glycosyltransferase [Alphaproteobacteria bacterium]